jgi:hypothetical protein
LAYVDTAFFFAVWAFGWGLSLATYRPLAKHHRWPLGTWHAERPRLPVAIGFLCMLLAGFFATARLYGGYLTSGLAIPVFGVAWAVFWTGFLRVGAQSALLLAPAAAFILLLLWIAAAYATPLQSALFLGPATIVSSPPITVSLRID